MSVLTYQITRRHMSAMAAFSICLAALNTKFKLYSVRIFQYNAVRKNG